MEECSKNNFFWFPEVGKAKYYSIINQYKPGMFTWLKVDNQANQLIK